MSTEANKAIVRRFWEEAFNKRNPEIVDELFDAAFMENAPVAGMEPNREAGKDGIRKTLAAFPDTRLTIDDLIAEGDRVVTRFTTSGTHTGEGGLIPIPPTGKKVSTSGITIHRVANGKIVESWTQADMLGMMQQLGLVPAPGQAG
jgi:steroid delta-isomerase-like uncharacterized protein